MKSRAVVIQRGNELSEFVQLLEELAVPADIVAQGLPSPEQVKNASVTIVLGNRLFESGTPNLSLWPRTIAVVDGPSKTLVAHLNRIGASVVVRRPIHPRTLRLLLLHEIYRGPERRRLRRTSIGHPIRIGAGLFKQRGMLLELSPNGARLALPNAPKVGAKLKLLVGKDLTKNKPLRLQAQVVRCIKPSGTDGREEAEIGVALIAPQRSKKEIAAILDRFSRGPASWRGQVTASETTAAPTPVAMPTPTPVAETPAKPERTVRGTDARVETPGPVEEIDPEESAGRLPPSFHAVPRAAEPEAPKKSAPPRVAETNEQTPPTEVAVDAAEASPAPPVEPWAASDTDDPSDRRRDPRIPYDRRVVALGEEAARVLVGRDISHGGMRIASNETVAVGDTLRVALHGADELDPLVLLATAIRDDGPHGTVLTFQALSEAQQDHLDQIISGSSPIQANDEDVDPNELTTSIVLGEMLETVDRGAPIESEQQIAAHLDSLFDTGESV